MNVTSVITKDYENVPLRRRGENKPNQTQLGFRILPIAGTGEIVIKNIDMTTKMDAYIDAGLITGTGVYTSFDGFDTHILLGVGPPPASNPRPANGQQGVTVDTLLRWKPGKSPVYGWPTEHHVYFGTDEAAAADANTSDPEYKATVPEDGNSVVSVTVVQNPSFESDVLADGIFIESEPNSWDTYFSGILYVWNPSGDGSAYFDSPVPDGNNVVVLDSPTLSEIWQYVPISGGLQAGQVYTMSAKHAGYADELNTTWVRVAMHASRDTGDPNDLWGPDVHRSLERAVDDRDWKEYSVALDVDALGVAGYDGVSLGLVTTYAEYDTSIYDDVRLTVYNPDNDPNYAPTMEDGTQYFWRIDEVYDNGGGQTVVKKGGVWSFTTSGCGQPGQYYDPADLNKDCYTDFMDFALFALDWLKCRDPANPDCDPWSGP